MNGNSAVLCVHNGIGFKLPLLGFVLVQTEEAMRCLKDIVRVRHSSISSPQGPHSLVFYSKCQYTLGPAVTLCCFVLLSQLGLSCWSFSGWLHHCICLPAVPRLSPCRNLASFKKTKKGNQNWFVLTNSRPLPVWLLTLQFPDHVLSAVVLCLLLSPC